MINSLKIIVVAQRKVLKWCGAEIRTGNQGNLNLEVSKRANNFATPQIEYLCHVQYDVVYSSDSSLLYLRHFAYHGIRKDCYQCLELEFLKSLWGLGTEEE